jgi:hypothetical protein
VDPGLGSSSGSSSGLNPVGSGSSPESSSQKQSLRDATAESIIRDARQATQPANISGSDGNLVGKESNQS